MIKKRKIVAFVLVFFLALSTFYNYPALAGEESDTESIAQNENEAGKEESPDHTEDNHDDSSGDSAEVAPQTETTEDGSQGVEESGANVPENDHSFDSEDKESEEAQAEEESEPQSNNDQVMEDGGAPGEGTAAYLPVTPALGGIANSTDVGGYIEFHDQELKFNNSIIEQDGHTFKYGSYTFSVNWKTTDQSITFDAGDYFTFEVPKEFGNLTFKMFASDGTSWGEITTDSNGNGKATFNQGVSGNQDLNGTIAMSGSYWETAENIPVEWKFLFGGEYTYTGVSEGIDFSDNQIYNNRDYKSGGPAENGAYRWVVHLNQRQADWAGKITVKDTLGSGHKMTAYGGQFIRFLGFYGKTNYHIADSLSNGEYFWGIALVDWDTMREYYNKIVEDSKNQGSSVVLDPDTGKPTDYKVTAQLNKGQYSTYMLNEMFYATYKSGDTIPDGKAVGSYKYLDKYTDGLESVEITDGGFTIVFPDGALSKKGVQIYYYTEASASIPQQTLKNTCEVSGADFSDKQDGKVTVTGGATVSGTKGKLVIFKQDSNERENLPGVEFTLKKTSDNGSYSETQSTAGDAGSTTFILNMPFEGTYMLSENPNTTPNGYKCAEPITLELNNVGEIVKINDTPVNGETTISGVGRINSDRLIFVVYNEKVTTTETERTVTKVWDDNNDQGGLRPTHITVRLLADGVPYEPEIELNKGNNWTHTWSGLPEKSGENTIVYTVEEISVPAGYTVKYSPDTFTITNKLQRNPGPVKVVINGTKTLTGKTLTDGMFRFEVRDESGKVVSTGTNKTNGEIVFNAISFSDPGTYTYTISEQNDGPSGIIYDTKIYTVQVVIEEDPRDSTLHATINYPDGDVKFQNHSVPSSAKVAFSATKRLLGRSLESGMFSFVVKDQAGNIVTSATNQSDGIIYFSEIEFTQPGIYIYTVEEINNGLYGILYDRTVYIVTVAVTQDGDLVSLLVSYPENGIVFTNSYESGNNGGSSGGSGGGSNIPDTSPARTPIGTASIPLSEPPLEEILGDGTPLTSLPKTGSARKAGAVSTLIGGAFCVAGLLLNRKNRKEGM